MAAGEGCCRPAAPAADLLRLETLGAQEVPAAPGDTSKEIVRAMCWSVVLRFMLLAGGGVLAVLLMGIVRGGGRKACAWTTWG